MECSYCNVSSDTVLLFSSKVPHSNANILRNLPHVHKQLNKARKYGMESSEYMEEFYNTIQYIKESLSLADMEYLCTLNSGDCKAINYDTMSRYHYSISLVNPNALTISINGNDLGKEIRFDSFEGKPIGSVRFVIMESGKTEYQSKISRLFQSLTQLKNTTPNGSSLFYNDDINRPDEEFDYHITMKIDPRPSKQIEFSVHDLRNKAINLLKKEALLNAVSDQDTHNFNINTSVIFLIVILIIAIIVSVFITIAIVRHRNRAADPFTN